MSIFSSAVIAYFMQAVIWGLKFSLGVEIFFTKIVIDQKLTGINYESNLFCPKYKIAKN